VLWGVGGERQLTLVEAILVANVLEGIEIILLVGL
jgi:hypothetical protein